MSIKPIPAKENHREYRSANDDGSPVRVTMGDGRVAIVGDTWRDLPLDMHNKAIRSGCECRKKGDDASGSNAGNTSTSGPEPVRTPAPARVGTDEAVRAAMIAAINDDPPDLLNETTGMPDPAVIAKYAGFGIAREQFTRVWKALHEDLRAAQEAEDAAEEAKVRQEGQDIADANAAAAAAGEGAADADASKLDPEKNDGVTVDANALEKRKEARKKDVNRKAARAQRAKTPKKPAAAK